MAAMGVYYELVDENIRGEYATEDDALTEVSQLVQRGHRRDARDLRLLRLTTTGEVAEIAGRDQLIRRALARFPAKKSA